MPRRSKGPRLHLRERQGRGRYWVILDAGRELGTGCGEGDREEAERALSRYIAEKYQPPKRRGDLDQIPIADVINLYLTEHAPSTSSLDWILHTAEPSLEWWGSKMLSDIRAAACRDYVKWRTEQGVSDQTARHDLKTLRAAINHYHAEHGPLTAVPAITLPDRAPQRRDYWLTRKQVADRIWAAMRTRQCRHVARMLLIGVYTGTRPGATLRLRWLPSADGGWFDLDSETLHRRGDEERETRKRQPPARIHRRLLPHLQRWREADLALNITHVIHYGGRPLVKLRRSWARVAGESGQAKWDSEREQWVARDGPHICRHTAATWLMQSRVDLKEAAGYLGMDPNTMWEVYGHHHPDFQRGAASATGRR
jgi:integrase